MNRDRINKLLNTVPTHVIIILTMLILHFTGLAAQILKAHGAISRIAISTTHPTTRLLRQTSRSFGPRTEKLTTPIHWSIIPLHPEPFLLDFQQPI